MEQQSTSQSAAFLSDQHLQPGVNPKTEAFFDFLDDLAPKVEVVYLIGDLFDFWIGPKHLKRSDYTVAVQRLRALTDAGHRLVFLHGNRDFLVGRKFAAASGVEVAGARDHIELGGQRILVIHGDRFFNRRMGYRIYRAIADFPPFKWLFGTLPGGLAFRLAGGLRSHSSRKAAGSPFANDQQIVDAAKPVYRKKVDVVICGHLHEHFDLEVQLKDRKGRLIVLGDWDVSNLYAVYRDGAFHFEKYHV